MILPKDLKIYCRKQILKRAVPCAILTVVFATILLLGGSIIFNTDNKVLQTSCYTVVMLFPFAITGVPHKLIDRSWTGIVTEICVKEKTGTYTAGGGKAFPYVKNVICLKVRKDNGKEKYIFAREFGVRSHAGFSVPNEGDVTQHLDEYSVGDQVYHFYGLKHYYIVKKNSEMVDCVVCGSQNPKERSNCLSCGHALIKNI